MEIIQGVVIGVSGSLTFAILIWLRNRYCVRPDEIRHFRDLILKTRKTIYSAEDLKAEDVPVTTPKHAVRLVVYKDMRKILFAALDGRASQLSFDEKWGLSYQVGLIDWLIDDLKKTPPLKTYKMMFDEWESMKWLGLPPYDGETPKE